MLDFEDTTIESKNVVENTKLDVDAHAQNSAMETGRAAARNLLRDMNDNENDLQPLPSPDDTESQFTFDNYFNTSVQVSHCMTICLVPPPSATKAWEQLMMVRRECKDPGYYRWPPHVNILYPFIEPITTKDSNKEICQEKFRKEIAIHLTKAARKCEPFDVSIDSFGTFGNKQQGVLWAYPMSKNNINDEEPLITLHGLLEEQFPICIDKRKDEGFHPHMTISHYPSNTDALSAMDEKLSDWESVSFRVNEIYLLERKGDDGQFKIAAMIGLGSMSEIVFHDPPKAFPCMPEVEEEWVHAERMSMKSRRKTGNKRRAGGS
jgi:2'-5' RNA ligase